MKTTRLAAIALAGLSIAAPAAAQAATSQPPAHTRLTGLPHGFKLSNPKAKQQKKHGKQKKQPVRARSSFAYFSNNGSIGAVTTMSPIQALHVSYAWMPTRLMLQNAAGPTVNRSPATSGAQDAVINYSMQNWNGQWVENSIARGSVRIPAGYSAGRLPHLTAFPNQGKGYIRVVHVISWYVAGTNTLLGTSVIVPDRASDQLCTTPVRACTQYDTFLHLG